MKKIFASIIFASLFISAPAMAEKSIITASNGEKITVSVDDFNEKSEITSKAIDFGNEAIPDGNLSFFVVASRKNGAGPAEDVFVQGYVMYRDDWHNYNVATFRGGDRANASFNERKVATCVGGDKCLLSERFTIHFDKDDIEKHARSGVLEIKPGCETSDQEPIVRIPLTTIDAVREVANR